jgi:hypothetical protein
MSFRINRKDGKFFDLSYDRSDLAEIISNMMLIIAGRGPPTIFVNILKYIEYCDLHSVRNIPPGTPVGGRRSV